MTANQKNEILKYKELNEKKVIKSRYFFKHNQACPFCNTMLSRYNQVGEIEFVIKSIIKFAPFINNIFIVTDGQSPKIIDESNSWRKEYKSM